MSFELSGRSRARRALLPVAILAAAIAASPALAADVMIPYDWSRSPLKDANAAGPVFAFAYPAEIDSRRDGTWSEADGVRKWTLQIRVPGAGSLAAAFDYTAVDGSVLAIAGEHFVASVADRVSRHQLGEVLELQMTAPASGGSPSLHIRSLRLSEPRLIENKAKVFAPPATSATAPPKADAPFENFLCHVTPANEGNGRAEAMIIINGIGQCSATLVNNSVGGVTKPLILTAGHCMVDTDDATAAAHTSVYWKYEVACGAAPESASPSVGTYQYGATSVHRWPQKEDPLETEGDVWLVQLDEFPPAAADAYLAGLDARQRKPDGPVYGIHHGSGRPKQFFAADTYEYETEDRNGYHYQYSQISSMDYTVGAVAPGASGSGLFDGNDRLVGVTGGGGTAGFGATAIESIWRLHGLGTYLVDDPSTDASKVIAGADVPAPTVPPAITGFTANPAAITVGTSVKLSWATTDAAACTASGDWAGTKPVNGTETVTPASEGAKTYTLTCTAGGMSATKSVAVTVRSAGSGDSGKGGGGAMPAGGLLLLLGWALTARRKA